MIVLEFPFISDFLARSAAESGLPVLRTPAAEQALDGSPVRWMNDAEFAAYYHAHPQARLYTNSENAIDWICRELSQSDLPRAIETLKDKVRFRELIADLDPDYRFVGLRRADLAGFDPSSVPVPFVVKPAVGFFSLGVHVVESLADWPAVRDRLLAECKKYEGLYPDSVLDLDRFVVEEVIEGREFAVDAYLDAAGKAVVLGILEHPFASGADVSDRVYFTSAETIETWRKPFESYLTLLAERAGLRNFPFHVELRVDSGGTIRPIEANPLRFGGWCAADIAHHAWGFDPYRMYLDDRRPDWIEILRSRRDWVWSLVVADLPSSVDRRAFTVDYEAFASRFTHLLELRRVTDPRHPVFAFAFVKVPVDSRGELDAILQEDLRSLLKPNARE